MKKIFLMLALSMGLTTAMQAQITTTAENQSTENPNAKYLAPIPQDEKGLVYLERELTLPEGSKTEETFAKLGDWLDRCMKDERIHASLKLDTTEPNTYSTMVTQEIVFSKSLLALDKAEISYVLNISVKDNKIILQMQQISYRYNGDNADRKMQRLYAENYIADKIALNKRGDKMYRNYRKFRTNTIDLIDEYADSLKMAFWIK